MKKLFFLSILVFLAMNFGCKSTKEVEINESKDEKTAQDFPRGKAFEVCLESNPTTGFSWECVIFDESVATLSAQKYEQFDAGKDIDGVGGIERFVFLCKKEGETQVVFTYRRPWKGGETATIRTALLKVDSNLNGTIDFIGQ